jgi:type III restriction enzyme
LIELYNFQRDAADRIAERVLSYLPDPATRGAGAKKRAIPFVQFLSSMTASGKTVILADAVEQIAAQAAIKPAVLWLSKLSVVVDQSFANLDVGGQYHDLISDFEVRPLVDLSLTELQTVDAPFLFFATVGKFNRRDEEGRKVFASQVDRAEGSIWDALRLRPDPAALRRPLLVVYDEAHNLTDQQTDLLLKLEPSAFLLSTATSRVRPQFETEVVAQLRANDFTDEDLIVPIVPSEVAKSELVKSAVGLIGRQAPMEDVVSEMVEDLRATEADGKAYGLEGKPKAVYVCRTNIVEGDARLRDDPKQPFASRQAPPILIWRHLVEVLDVDPSEIAVYCDLKVDKGHPLPDEFVLYSGGDKDYDHFVAGGYRHIIFNLSLQEGWDDPLVYFAYIDKTLGSTIAAEQIVGRLLRQPGRQHYPAARLNTAQVHVRVETNTVFTEVVNKTQARLRDDKVPVVVTSAGPGKKHLTVLEPRKTRSVPEIAEHFDEAIDELAEIEADVPHFADGDPNAVGVGYRAQLERVVGSVDEPAFEWVEVGKSTAVLARWLFSRALSRLHPRAASAMALSDDKWDRRIGIGSSAAKTLEEWAEKAGRVFVDESYVEVATEDDDDYTVGDYVARGALEQFENSLHEGYDGLNPSLELPFARALDKLGVDWARNPSQSGYWIPIIRIGGNTKFYPDFIAWGAKDVFVIDTKGSHLEQDLKNKLVRLAQADGRPKVHIRFVTNGKYDTSGTRVGQEGFTVVGFRQDQTVRYRAVTDLDAAAKLAVKPTL